MNNPATVTDKPKVQNVFIKVSDREMRAMEYSEKCARRRARERRKRERMRMRIQNVCFTVLVVLSIAVIFAAGYRYGVSII